MTAVKGTTTISYVYDGDGIRVGKTLTDGTNTTITRYLTDGNNPTGYVQTVEELNGGYVVQKRYVYGLDLISQTDVVGSNGTQYYGYDGTGSTRLLTDSTGSVVQSYDYDAFGSLLYTLNPLLSTNSYLFHGEYFDSDLGLVFLRARWMDTGIGRFTTQDNYEGDSEQPISLHKYVGFNNSPVMIIDPSGREGIEGASRITELLQGLIVSPDTVIKLVIQTAKKYNIPINVFGALIYSESGFKVSDVGLNFNSTKTELLSVDLGLGQINQAYDEDEDGMVSWEKYLEIMQPADNLESSATILIDKKDNYAPPRLHKFFVNIYNIDKKQWEKKNLGFKTFDLWYMSVLGYKTPSTDGLKNTDTWNGYFKKWPKPLKGSYLNAWEKYSK